MKYSTLIFDFGGVIINIDFNLTHQAFQELGVSNLSEQFAQHQQNHFFDKFEKGQISPAEFRAEMRTLIPQKITDNEIDTAWNAMLLDIPAERIAFIEKLKQNYRCVLLSNTNQIHYDYYRQNFEKVFGYAKFSDLFDATFFSHEMGMRKPDADIFENLLMNIEEDREKVLFIDDTEKNIVAAKQLNIPSLLWKSTDLTKLSIHL